MAPPRLSPPERTEEPVFSPGMLTEEMEHIPEPAILYMPGGRVAAVNSAAARLSDFRVVGQSMVELIRRSSSRRADGSPLLAGDLPYTRALRGEVVDQGERIEIVLPDGSAYPALVTSAPVVVDGKVVAALSIWHDFNAYLRDLAGDEPPDKK